MKQLIKPVAKENSIQITNSVFTTFELRLYSLYLAKAEIKIVTLLLFFKDNVMIIIIGQVFSMNNFWPKFTRKYI